MAWLSVWWCSGYHARLLTGKRGFESCSGNIIFLSFQRPVSKAVCSLFTSLFQRLQGFLGFRKFLSIFYNFRVSRFSFVCVAVPLHWDDFTLKLLYVDFRLSWVDFLLLRVDFLLSWDVTGKEKKDIVNYCYLCLFTFRPGDFSEKQTSSGKFEIKLINRLNTKILFPKLGLAILVIKLVILKARQIKKWSEAIYRIFLQNTLKRLKLKQI